MKKNTIILIAVLLLGVLGIGSSKAQSQQPYKGSITVEPVRVEHKHKKLYVEMNVILDQVKLRSQQGVNLMPYIESSGRKLYLPEIELKGKDEHLSNERKLTLMGRKKRDTMQMPYMVERIRGRYSDTLKYNYEMPYEPWMDGAQVKVQYDLCGCGHLLYTMDQTDFVSNIVRRIPYEVVPHLVYIRPDVETVKSREIQAEAFLDFEVNKTEIRPEYMNNPEELTKIRRMIDELNADPDITIRSLKIVGYASPEGSLENNKRLSEGRARALRNYLSLFYKFSSDLTQIEFGGENWDGLARVLENSEFEYKEIMLDIISNYTVEQGRKSMLMKLDGGTPYRYMLKFIYPGLRVAVCKVQFDVRSFDLEKAKEVILTRPQNLSLEEMFLVANSYPEGSQEFMEVFETAVRMFPENEIANLNAATSAVSRRDQVSALKYLNRVNPASHPEAYYNTLGMLQVLQNEYHAAEESFREAAEYDSHVGAENLEELEKKRRDIENE
ncbi:DUF3868 domain-containing protein [uncultured Alistipes sp.]|jgi:hypothetical protein bacD2_01038|uniref:DUF3868 domain-containing protein n=1 Tax=uncultured Alistipes sp. TaxID=538949 RepID=UPI0025D4D6D5|nr:DUF3868 domain-containing protein [uncultured Alistipes sp.]